MSRSNAVEMMVYLAGVDADDAMSNMPFTDVDDAIDYIRTELGGQGEVYSATCVIEFDTMDLARTVTPED